MINLAPIFKGASGGKSDDIFVGIPDSFQDSKNIEIRQNPRGITLTKRLSKDSSTTVVEAINCFVKASTGDIFAFGNSGGVYHKTGGVWYKNTNSITGAITSAIEFNGYLYLTNATKLYRVAAANWGHSMSFTEYQTFSNSGNHPISVYANNFMFIGDKNIVASLDTLGVYTSSKLSLVPSSDIKFIKAQGSSVKLYCQSASSNSTEIFYWDGVDTSISETSSLGGVNIEQLVSKDGLDYAITNNRLGIIDGYKASSLKTISGYSTNLNSITVKGNRILYGGTGGIYEWGNLNKNYPEVLSFSYATSNASTDTVNAIFFDGTDLYVSWSNGSTHGIDKLNTTYSTTGYLTTRVYYGDFRVLRKSALNVLSAFSPVTGSDSIKIYYRFDITGSYTLLDTITSDSVKTNAYTNILPINGTWNFVEFKIELNSGDGSTTPEFYELFLELNDLKK